MIKVACPSCASPYDLDERRLPASGIRMRCPKCGASFHVAQSGSVGGNEDLPKPKAASGALDDLPKPKAPPPPRPKGTMVGMGAVGAAPADAFSGIDLPVAAPKPPPKAPGTQVGFDDLDLPRAKATNVTQEFSVPRPPEKDLPKPSVDFELDLPVPQRGNDAKAKRDSLDLDVSPGHAKRPAIATPFDGDMELPQVQHRPAQTTALGSSFDDDLDLPQLQGRPGLGAIDSDDGLDLPKVQGSSGGIPDPFGDGFDLPQVQARGAAAVGSFAADLDLPRVQSPSLPGSGQTFHDDLDLPTARTVDKSPTFGGSLGDFSDEIDLPTRATADLPQPRALAETAFLGDLDLAPKDNRRAEATAQFGGEPPTAKAAVELPALHESAFDLPTPADNLPVPRTDAFDLMDDDPLALPPPRAAQPTAAARPAPPALKASPSTSDFGFGDMEDLAGPSIDLNPPSAKPAAESQDLFDLPDFQDDFDLSLPEGKARGQGASSAQPAGRFGAIELDSGVDTESLEFDALPQSDDLSLDTTKNAPRLDLAGEVDAHLERAPKLQLNKGKAPRAERKLPVAAMVGTLFVLLFGAGISLQWTEHGIFGRYYFEQYLSAAGTPEAAAAAIRDAEAKAADDTYGGVRAALRSLSEKRSQFSLNRELLARSAVHEALFQIRFGSNLQSEARESAILSRLAERGNKAKGIDLALAAKAVRAGDLAAARRHLASAKRSAAADPYVSLVLGELELKAGNAAAAVAAFTEAHAAGARAQWGLARAHRRAGETEAAAAAVAATLAASPSHGGALVASAESAWARQDEASAMDLALYAAGHATPEGRPEVVASAEERGAALAVVGSIHEFRGRRVQATQAYEASVDLDPFAVAPLLGLGRIAQAERRFRDALVRFEAAEEAAREQAEAVPGAIELAGLGQVQAQLELAQPQQAQSKIEALLRSFPESIPVAQMASRVWLAMEQPDRAVEQMNAAIALDETRFESYMALATIHFDKGDAAAAGAVLQRARTHVPPSPEMFLLLAKSELQRGNLDQAEIEVRQGLALQEADPALHFLLGQIFGARRNLAEAETAFARVAALDANFPGLSVERGRIFEAQGNAPEAARAYASALVGRPDDMDLVLRYGAALLASGRTAEAAPHILRALESSPNTAEVLYYAGRLATAQSDFETATRHLEHACELDPRIAVYRLALARGYLGRNVLDRAAEEAAAALALDPTLPDAYAIRGRIALRGAATIDARRDFERALQLKPDHAEAFAGLGEALDQLGQKTPAIQALARAVALDGTRPEWWYQLGKVRTDAGQTGDAVAALSRAIELGPEGPSVWFVDALRLRGNAYRAQGARASAVADFERYLRVAPGSDLDRPEVEMSLYELRNP